jgi:hypothetical protein
MSEVCIRLEWQIQNVLDNELEEEEKEFLAAQKIDGESEGALPVYLVGRLRVKFATPTDYGLCQAFSPLAK